MKTNSAAGLLLGLLLLAGCQSSPPEAPVKPGFSSTAWKTDLDAEMGYTAGRWSWSWTTARSSGSAQLELVPLAGPRAGWQINWSGGPSCPWPTDGDPVLLEPDDRERWHSLLWLPAENPLPVPCPLPRVDLDSSQYPNLLAFLQNLTAPFFHQIVTHWPDYPIAVRLVPAQNQEVDLAACLTEAIRRWNRDEQRPWFQLDQQADWGVRLVFFPDRNLRPPISARITRLDSNGRPLRVNIVVGNTYDDQRDRPYAVRAFVHELGHALFLWGHSTDRAHCLWGAAPPLVDEPSLDERKAARWWHGLPDGLDLSRYDSAPITPVPE